MSLPQHFMTVVIKAQNEEYCHKKLIKSIENSFDVANLDIFLKVYTRALFGIYNSDCASKNPFVARGLEFLAKLAVKITLKCVQPLDITNPNGTISRVYDITTDPFFTSLLKCSLRYASVEKSEVRFNTCYFVMVLLQNIGNNVELDYSLCNRILESLLELLHDPKVNVRLQALKALVRLQEPGNPECVVLKSFLVLFTDINSEVRKAVVSLIAPHPQSFPKIRERLTDTDVGVRQAAYTKCADTNPRLYYKIVDRHFILTCAFADQNKKIKQLLTEKLLPKWLHFYGGNYLDLLKGLKLDADDNDIKRFEDLCTKVMEVYLKSNPLSDIMDHLPINKEDKLIPIKQLYLESVIYWTSIIDFLRKREDAEDYLEDVLPELTQFSNYIERVIKEKSAISMDEWENMEYQNIVFQLFQIASGFDMSDEVGRRTFYSLVLQILSSYKFQRKVIDMIISVAAQLNRNIDTFTTDLCQVISEIREPLIDELPSQDQLRTRNFEMSQMKVKIHQLEIAEEEALKIRDFQHANIVHNELMECQRQLENLIHKYSNSEKVRVSKDDPETLCRCLDILIGLLKMKNITKMSAALHTCKDEFLMPLVSSNISEVHWRFILCLGLFSLLDKETAFKHAKFICLPIATYRAIPNYDKAALKISVACVTDLIRVHGVKVIGIEEDTNSELSQEQNQTTTRRKLYSEDMEELQVVNKDDISIEFIIDIILDMLDDEDEDVRNTASSSISRLMVHNFPVNPELISRLILKWYNPLTEKKDTKLQQQIGVIIKCFTDKVRGARKIVGKAVIPIISSLANAPMKSPLIEIDIDNVIRFLSALTSTANTDDDENIHNNLALSIIEKISDKPNDVCTPHLAKLLTYLEVQFEDPLSQRRMIASAELLLADVVDKAPNKNILKFVSRLRANMTVIPEEESQVTTEAAEETQGDSQSTLNNNSTNHAEDKTQDISLGNALNGSKFPRKSGLSSGGNEQRSSLGKRTLYLHSTENELAGKDKNEDESEKGNTSENESHSEEEFIENNEKVRNKKNRNTIRATKRLSLMKIRRKSFKLSENPLKGNKTLQKVKEKTEAENGKLNVAKKQKKKSSEAIIHNTRHNGKVLTTVQSSRKNSSNEGCGDSEETTKNINVFVKCDYTPLKSGKKSISDKGLHNSKAAKRTPEKKKDSLEKEKEPSKQINGIKQNVEQNSSKELNLRHSVRSQKIKIISQVCVKNSESAIVENLPKSGPSEPLPTTSVQNVLNKRKQIQKNSAASPNVDSSGKSSIEAEKNSERTSDDKLRRSSQISSSQVFSKKISSADEDPTMSSKNTSSVAPSPVRSSTRVIVTPKKLLDYDTPSSNNLNHVKTLSQGSAGRTPFRKRVANTPLSVGVCRLSKRLSRKQSANLTPRNKDVNSGNNSIKKLKSPSVKVGPSKKNSTICANMDSAKFSHATPNKKRLSESPTSLAREKPHKIRKIMEKSDDEDYSIKIENFYPKTKNGEIESKISRKKILTSKIVSKNNTVQTGRSRIVDKAPIKKPPAFSSTKNSRLLRRNELRKSIHSRINKTNKKEADSKSSQHDNPSSEMHKCLKSKNNTKEQKHNGNGENSLEIETHIIKDKASKEVFTKTNRKYENNNQPSKINLPKSNRKREINIKNVSPSTNLRKSNRLEEKIIDLTCDGDDFKNLQSSSSEEENSPEIGGNINENNREAKHVFNKPNRKGGTNNEPSKTRSSKLEGKRVNNIETQSSSSSLTSLSKTRLKKKLIDSTCDKDDFQNLQSSSSSSEWENSPEIRKNRKEKNREEKQVKPNRTGRTNNEPSKTNLQKTRSSKLVEKRVKNIEIRSASSLLNSLSKTNKKREVTSKNETSKRNLQRTERTEEKVVDSRSDEDSSVSPLHSPSGNSGRKRNKKMEISKQVVSSSRTEKSRPLTRNVNVSPKSLRSDKNVKPNSNSKGIRVLKSLNSAMNKINSASNAEEESSKNVQTSKTKSENVCNILSRTRLGSRVNGNLSIQGHSPRTSTVTRSRRFQNGRNTMNGSSKKCLNFSSSSEETILKTFLQGDEEFQILEDISIEDMTTRSNISGDSKKENISIDTSSTSNSFSKSRSSTRRRTLTKEPSSSDSESPPKRKILRTNQKRILRSVAH